MTTKPLAVIALSGGMDSCVTLAIAQAQGFDAAVLHVNYGQRTQRKELLSFRSIADHYDIPSAHRLEVDLNHLKMIGGSSLVDENMKIPEGDADRKGIPSTYVPFRNGHLLSIAVSWAEILEAGAIFVGFVEEDGSGYPDCTFEFLKRFEAAARQGTKPTTHLTFHAPLIAKNKQAIVQEGLDLQAPLHLSWSCYQNEEQACGACDSCLLRLRGFHGAQYVDPISYLFIPKAYQVTHEKK